MSLKKIPLTINANIAVIKNNSEYGAEIILEFEPVQLNEKELNDLTREVSLSYTDDDSISIDDKICT